MTATIATQVLEALGFWVSWAVVVDGRFDSSWTDRGDAALVAQDLGGRVKFWVERGAR